MKIYAIESGNFKLDGGAMFGVVPKSIWNKTNPADQNNMIELAARCLLIEDGNKLILVDTGMGNKQSEKFFSYYAMWGPHSLDKSLAAAGFSKDVVTDVFMTHLHFDHCGGSVVWNKNRTAYETAFKNARFWSNEDHWNWAVTPNSREKASFLTENILPIQESGQLHFVSKPETDFIDDHSLGFGIFFANGHTEKMMIPKFNYQGRTVCFMADLLPTAGHIPLPYVMGYDTRPLLTLPEKDKFLREAAENEYLLVLEHDAHNEVITVEMTDRGVRLKKSYRFDEIFA